MKIPGLTFIIAPIICWILYKNSKFIINLYNEQPTEFILLFSMLYVIAFILELFMFRFDKNKTDKQIFNSVILLKPFISLYTLLVFINKSLTVKI